MPPQLREIGFHVQNHATQWHGFQHEIQFQEVGVAWIQLTQDSSSAKPCRAIDRASEPRIPSLCSLKAITHTTGSKIGSSRSR